MSIIIKGVDLPKEHGYINITVFGDGETYYEYNMIDSGEYQTTAIQIANVDNLIPLEDVFRTFPELEPYRQGLTGLTILESEENDVSNIEGN